MTSTLLKSKIKENQRELKDTVYLMALQGLNYVMPLLVLPYLMVTLGAEKFGYIGFALSVCQYLVLFIDFGFNLSTTKRIAISKEDSTKLNRIFSAAVYSKMFLLLVAAVIMFIITLIPQFIVYRKVVFVMFSMVVGNAFLFVFLFQGLGQIRWVSIFTAIAKLTVLPLTFVFVKCQDDYLIAALLQSGVTVVTALISLVMIIKNRWVYFPRLNITDCKEEIKESFPIFLSNVTSSFYVFCFTLILGYFATPDEVGRYSASDKIVHAVVSMIMVTTFQAFYPSISSLAVKDKLAAAAKVRLIMLTMYAIMAAIIVAIFIVAPYLPQWLGQDYAGTETILRIMSFITIFIAMGGVYGQLGVLAIGDYSMKKKFSKVYVQAGIVAIVSVFALTPLFYGVGAAIAILLTEIFAGCSMYRLYRQMLRNE